MAELETIKAKTGKVVLLSNTLASPSSYKAVNELRNSITGGATTTEEGEEVASTSGAQFEHIQYDSVSYAGIRKANELSFGEAVIPDYDFSKAKTIVSFGADFLSTWLLATQYAGQYAEKRNQIGRASCRERV